MEPLIIVIMDNGETQLDYCRKLGADLTVAQRGLLHGESARLAGAMGCALQRDITLRSLARAEVPVTSSLSLWYGWNITVRFEESVMLLNTR